MDKKLKKIFKSPNNKNLLSGYYTDNIFSECGNYIILTEVDKCFEYPSKENPSKIWLANIYTSDIKLVDKSEACNFQQGCKAQFIKIYGEEYIIYNRWNKEKEYYSKAKNIHNDNIVIYDFPIDNISKDGKYISSINFKKIDNYKRSYGYGYYTTTNKLPKSFLNCSLKIYLSDSGDLFDEIELKNLETFSESNNIQFLEHSLFNPASDKIAFFHNVQNGSEININFYIYDMQVKKIKLIKNITRCTHYNWLSNNEIIIWGSKGNIFTFMRKIAPNFLKNKLLTIYKKLVKGNKMDGNDVISQKVTGDRYFKINLNNNSITDYSKNKDLNLFDGHPSLIKKNNILVTDNYPNRENLITLKLLDHKREQIIHKKTFKHNNIAVSSEFRADLHPNVSDEYNLIVVDTFEDDKREVHVYKLSF